MANKIFRTTGCRIGIGGLQTGSVVIEADMNSDVISFRCNTLGLRYDVPARMIRNCISKCAISGSTVIDEYNDIIVRYTKGIGTNTKPCTISIIKANDERAGEIGKQLTVEADDFDCWFRKGMKEY